jgi:Ca2+-binding RTX toxin-like protein
MFLDSLSSEAEAKTVNTFLIAFYKLKNDLQYLLDDPDFVEKMNLAFSNLWDRDKAKTLLQSIVKGDSLPAVKIVSSDRINGGNGAFDSYDNIIYLSDRFVADNASNQDAIKNVLLEELGHYLDAQINTSDSAGDEGAIFAAMAQGKELSESEIAALQSENDTTTITVNGEARTVELSTTYGNITVDGNLSDWTPADRLDFLPGTLLSGFEIYGKYAGDTYLFAIKSDGNAIGTGTTFWLNTDQDPSTGYQIFGFAGGAEYNIDFQIDPLTLQLEPKLYTGDTGENLVNGSLDRAYSSDGIFVELAVPIASLNLPAPRDIDLLADVNNSDFLPPNYGYRYTVDVEETPLPVRTDFSKKVGIVFSETTANNFFKRPGETDSIAYSQLFMSMQYQAMMAGIPFDILTEDDLTDINNLVNYDTLIFPSFSHVPTAKLNAIEETLLDAVYKYNIGIITAGDFLTNSENGAALPGDPYQRMREILNLNIAGGSGSNLTNINLQVTNGNNSVLQGYATDELIRQYTAASYNTYNPVDSRYTGEILVDFQANGQTNTAVQTTQTGGRNVHFGTTSFLADNNLVWQALQWSILGNQPKVGLNMSRDASIFISRTDMDQSQESFDVNPDNNAPGIYDELIPILENWEQTYDFVGSYYINIGNNPPDQETDWSISKPYYDAILALGNEIGTHSYTHPDNTNLLNAAQLEFEFNQSQLEIEQRLGISVTGAAIPGAPESLAVNQQIKNYLDYVTGGYASVGAGYPGAFGFLFPDDDYIYFAPNIKFDFSLIEFEKLTTAQAEAEWAKEYTEVTNKANQAIILWPWHDYGPTVWPTDPPNPAPPYTEDLFTNFIARAYNDNTEFVTLDDLHQRIKTFEQTPLFLDIAGDTITANVVASDVGNFSLDVNSDKSIQNVQNWYAYDSDTVFLSQTGGTFVINLGTSQDDVTHIIDLPMRSELISLSGDGTNLNFTFSGEGEVAIDVKNSPGFRVTATGADTTELVGELLTLTYNNLGVHTSNITIAPDAPPIVANPIIDVSVLEDASDTLIDLSSVFSDSDDPIIDKTVQSNSNQTLVNAYINPSNANQLILDYQPNQFGTADITIRGTSNGQTVDDTFTVNVASVDDAPTVSVGNQIADVTVIQDAANTTIDLSNVFSDVDNDVAAITKTVASNSNNSLVTANITGNTLTLDYQPSQFGTATITIQGTSNGLSVNDSFTVTVNPLGNVINGTTSSNNITGTNGTDIINGLGGNDTLNGQDGNDIVDGGEGNDDLKGGNNDDILYGGLGNDKLDGENENDTLYGGEGNDDLKGGNNNDILYGEVGNDTLDGENENDTLYGGDGRDTLNGGNHNDYLYGGKGNDSLKGENDNDILTGVDLNDPLLGLNEIDTLSGNDGADRFVLGDASGAYYNDGNNSNSGFNDYALIKDFSRNNGDKIQLYGNAANYQLENSPGGLPKGVAIFFKTDGTNELIGIVEKAKINDLNSAFEYIDSISSLESIRVEAESTNKNTYRTESLSSASGGNVISLLGGSSSETGTASFNFTGSSGYYDVLLAYYDENDGTAQLSVKKGSSTLDSWTLNQNLGSNLPNTQTFTTRTVAQTLFINTGDTFTISGTENNSEYARVDYMEFLAI